MLLLNQSPAIAMWGRTLLCFCAVLASSNANDQNFKVVNIAQGPVKGYKDPDHGFYAFKSIPYATAPTGPHRFKAPLPPPVWMQPLEAVSKKITCPQAKVPLPFEIEEQMIQEDCLIANVYVPDTDQKNLPVVFYVHGGAFQLGSSEWFTPKELITENNIIFISINYRLSVHGFLCLGTKDVPGNAGMKDQVAALRWVKENVASFGGNPEDITLQGSSAGSAAVDLLMLSKLAKGLFNKVIPESGANVGVWAIQANPLENAKWFAKTLNFTNVDDIYALEQFYKTASFEMLTSNAFFDRTDSTFVFSPCVERDTGEEVFLDKSPVDILKSGNYEKVPMLYGFANMEGLFRAPLFDIWKTKMNEKFSDFLPADLTFKSEEEKEATARAIKEFYFEDKPVGQENILSYVDYFTDVLFAYPTLRAVKYHVDAGHNQVYLYEYSFVDEDTPYVPHTSVKGANHCGQTMAVFNGMIGQPNATKSDDFKKMSAIMRNIWGSFIKTGVPVVEMSGEGYPAGVWQGAGERGAPHMSLGAEVVLRGPLLERRAIFWDDIYSRYYRDPVLPPPPPTDGRNEL